MFKKTRKAKKSLINPKNSMLLDDIKLKTYLAKKSGMSQYATNIDLSHAHQINLKSMELKIVKSFRQKRVG